MTGGATLDLSGQMPVASLGSLIVAGSSTAETGGALDLQGGFFVAPGGTFSPLGTLTNAGTFSNRS